MPKKTKREKIIAEYRRKLHGIRESVPASPEQVNDTVMSEQTESPPLFIYQKKAMPSYTPAAVVQPMDRAIRRDLVKTLILAAAAIGAEVALSRIIQ